MRNVIFYCLIAFLFNFFELNALEITEVFPDPKGKDTETNQWVEIKNNSNTTYSRKITIKTNSKTLSKNLFIEPYQYQIINIDLANKDEKISILEDQQIIDQVYYTTSTPAQSFQKIQTREANIESSNWIWQSPSYKSPNVITTKKDPITTNTKQKEKPHIEAFIL